MTIHEVRAKAPRVRHRSPNGLPVFVETQHVRLTRSDLHNLSMIRQIADLAITDSELLRTLLRCAADDLLGGYDLLSVDRPRDGVTIIRQRRRKDDDNE